MDLSEIREFVILAEELSYAAAAERLFISRSSLTKHIQSIENEVGVKLLSRDNRSVSLTEAGRNFLEKSKTLIEDYIDAIESTREIAARKTPVLRVGYLFETAGDFFPQACADFMKGHDVSLSFRSMEVEQIRESVIEGSLDMGLTIVVPDELPAECEALEIDKDLFGLIVSSSSPLAKRDGLFLPDLAGMTLYGPNPHHLPLEARSLSQYLRRQGDSVRVISSISDIGSIRPALKTGAQAVFSIGHVARRFGDDVSFVPLADFGPKPSISLIWRKAKGHPDAADFARCVKASFDSRQLEAR